MASSSNPVGTMFAEASQLWDVERLRADLAKVKQNKLSPTESACLQGLLCGIDPNEIAATLHRQPQGLRVDLSRGLYRYVEGLTEKQIKNWREVALVLERAGYKLQPVFQQHGLLADSLESGQPTSAMSPLTIRQNLPARDFDTLIGRDREMHQLLTTLSFDCPTHCISIEGIGGMGKTTLALSAAYRCLQRSKHPSKQAETPAFEAIVFTSAKQQHLTSYGILPRLKSERSLREIFRAIARTLDCSNLLLSEFDQQLEQLQQHLIRQHTLLIVDNLETVEDYSSVLSFLYDLPATVKVVITNRQQSPFASIRLEPLPELESIHLIQHQAQIKGVRLSQEDAQRLYQRTSGIPAAMIYALGQLAAGYPLKDVPTRLTLSQGDYSRFYFESSVALLKGWSHQLLMTLALFPRSASREAIADLVSSPDLVEPNSGEIVEGLARLQQLSLVNQDQGRYDMLPLTREFAIAELTAHPNFEQQVRERWVKWYLNFAQAHGAKDWKEWNESAPVEQEWENLQYVIEWCITQNRYADVRQFLQQVSWYTHAQGYRSDRLSYWSTRLDWADWLIQAAEQHQDWATLLNIMFDQGWTLTLMGQPQHLRRANELFQRAWELRHHKDFYFQVDLAIHMAALWIQQQQFEQANSWLCQAKQLLDTSQIDRLLIQRSQIHLLYYQGEICYKTQNYEQAQQLFQQVLKQAQEIDWRRAIFLAKGWLADTAIQQGNFEQAQFLLEEGLQIAKENRDQCRAAFCQRSLACLESARGNGAIAHRWAKQAKQSFEYLGMLAEARETDDLLQTINRAAPSQGLSHRS